MYKQFKVLKHYFPFRINFFILVAVIIMAVNWLAVINNTNNNFQPIIYAMCKITIIFGVVLLLLSLTSVLVAYLFFRKQMHRDIQNFTVEVEEAMQGQSAQAHLAVQIKKVTLPLWGYLKWVLLHNEYNATGPFNIGDTSDSKGILVKKFRSSVELQLPEIKTYSWQKGILLFQDFFRLYSLPYIIKSPQVFRNKPLAHTQDAIKVLPKKTDDTIFKIEQLRKVDGELLHYKKYSPADDTRRIVWKIFAKNRELVVRTPEIFNPFASHVYMYASYYNQYLYAINHTFNNAMLSYYKQQSYAVYSSLQMQDVEVKFISDQEVSAVVDVANKITESDWQKSKTLAELVQPKHATIIVLQSTNQAADVQYIVDNIDKHTIVYFIKLSELLKQNKLLGVLEKIFLHPKADGLSATKSKWAWHPYKQVVLKNEKAIMAILQTHPNVIIL